MIGAFISLHITGMEQKNHYTILYAILLSFYLAAISNIVRFKENT